MKQVGDGADCPTRVLLGYNGNTDFTLGQQKVTEFREQEKPKPYCFSHELFFAKMSPKAHTKLFPPITVLIHEITPATSTATHK